MDLLRRILRRLFGSVVLASVTFVGAPLAFGATVLAGLILLPLPAAIPVPKANPIIQPTVIYDRYGHPIATLQSFDKNLPFTDAQVPQVLKEAVIADEDRNFYHESGIDIRGTIRAAWADIRNHAPVQGGSTITQQYVKLAYTNRSRTLYRKIREAILASQLSRVASKEQILYHYLTLIYLGDGNYGAAAAAETYFHVPISQLNASQAATLAGLIPAPSARAPEEHLAGAEVARELVLKKMYQQHYLTDPQYQAALAAKLAPAGPSAPPGATVVYPQVTATGTRFPDFVDYTTRWLQAHFPQSVLETGGLRVQTTLDPAVQNDATAVVAATLDGSAMPVDMALASVEPQTGFVEALVGGRDFGGNGPYEKDNLALGGCTAAPSGARVQVGASCWDGSMITGGGGGRQPGSSWKPFTLAAAFEKGIQPSTVYQAPFIYQIPGCKVPAGQPASACQIHNDPGEAGGPPVETLAEATAQSTNTVYAQVAQQVGCDHVADTAKKAGIETAYYSTPPFYYCGTYALGELGVSPLDMASAYGVFADHGQRAAPTPILEIVNAQGKVLLDNIKHRPGTTAVMAAPVADNVTNVLEGVLTHGTATVAQLGRPAAGKTGTTNNTTDAWFVGYTPTLSTAVWMGRVDSDAKSLGPVTGQLFKGGPYYVPQVYGGTWPAITWKEYMQLALANVPVTPFSAPAPLQTPAAAAALQGRATTTTAGIAPGGSGYAQPTPDGGPYTAPAPTPVAPPPPTAATTTTSTTTSTTVAPSSTAPPGSTGSSLPGSGGPGGPGPPVGPG
ncbi:MAG TPA: transglycosylase domain-containing protein [Acidimicrobiales bacterium]|nr:transglycosylase domain-containing protein [Acidimicrobiales bacterium]